MVVGGLVDEKFRVFGDKGVVKGEVGVRGWS